jgi:hypothetical protein
MSNRRQCAVEVTMAAEKTENGFNIQQKAYYAQRFQAKNQ